jgi:hypothetical protein
MVILLDEFGAGQVRGKSCKRMSLYQQYAIPTNGPAQRRQASPVNEKIIPAPRMIVVETQKKLTRRSGQA